MRMRETSSMIKAIMLNQLSRERKGVVMLDHRATTYEIFDGEF